MQNEKRKNLTILIVGETSRAENFSLNGYPRETNPRLAKDTSLRALYRTTASSRSPSSMRGVNSSINNHTSLRIASW